MVFDTFGIFVSGFRVDAERNEEIANGSVTLTRHFGKRLPLIGQKDRAIRLRGDKAIALQALDRVVDGRFGDTEPVREIHQPRFARFLDQLGDQLDVILGDLGLVRIAHALKALGVPPRLTFEMLFVIHEDGLPGRRRPRCTARQLDVLARLAVDTKLVVTNYHMAMLRKVGNENDISRLSMGFFRMMSNRLIFSARISKHCFQRILADFYDVMRNRPATLATSVFTACAAIVVLAASSISASASDNPAAKPVSTPLKVIATTGMIADAARVVGGDLVEVTALMGPGVDPHAYRQTRSDVVALSKADLVLWHGLGLEAQLEELLTKLKKRQRVVAIGEHVPKDLLIAHDTYEGRSDPHIWMDPDLWARAILVVRSALGWADAANSKTYSENAAIQLFEIGRLSAYAQIALSAIPEERRVLITAHDAFNYFGRAYKFEVLGIQGISTESEAGLKRIGELVDLIVERKIAAVFAESSVSDRSVRALIEGAAARGHKVEIGGELFSDAMGPEGTYRGTYLGMIDHNITTISRALGGSAPEGGMDGKLGGG